MSLNLGKIQRRGLFWNQQGRLLELNERQGWILMGNNLVELVEAKFLGQMYESWE